MDLPPQATSDPPENPAMPALPSTTVIPVKMSTTEVALEPTDEAVLSFLRKRGLGSAALELEKVIRASGGETESSRGRLEMEEAESRAQRTLLSRSTGGGYGYDQDGSAQVPQWGVPDIKLNEI